MPPGDPGTHPRRWQVAAAAALIVLAGAALLRHRQQAAGNPQPYAVENPDDLKDMAPPDPASLHPRGLGLAVIKPGTPPSEKDPMTAIPGGTFQMGDVNGDPDEVPVHAVTVAPFSLDLHEVTVRAYAACVQAGGCTPASETVAYGEQTAGRVKLFSEFCNARYKDRLDHPVNCVDAFQAEDYCRWQGKRLPTEEEWEYAARGGDQERKFAWGDTPPTPELANLCGGECIAMFKGIDFPWTGAYPTNDPYVNTAPVGSFPAGAARWGNLDMVGNVKEFTATEYCPYLQPNCHSGQQVGRGSAWMSALLKKIRVARRVFDVPWHRSQDLGMRCAQ